MDTDTSPGPSSDNATVELPTVATSTSTNAEAADIQQLLAEKEREMQEKEKQMHARLRELMERERQLEGQAQLLKQLEAKRPASAAFDSGDSAATSPAPALANAPANNHNTATPDIKRQRLDSDAAMDGVSTAVGTAPAFYSPSLHHMNANHTSLAVGGTTTDMLSFSDEQKKIAINILQQLSKQPEGAWFSLPVDTIMYSDYLDTVKTPMDFSTISRKINNDEYTTAEEYIAESRLVFSNCRLYNKPDTPVAKGANKLESLFNRALAKLRLQQQKDANARGVSLSSPVARPIIRRDSDFSIDRPKRAKHEPPPKDLIGQDRLPKASRKLSTSLKFCVGVLRELMSKKYRDINHPFLQPVDWQLLGLFDYPNLVKHPMDLGTTKRKLETGQYSSPTEFAADVRLVWSNCMKYNPRENPVHQMAVKLSKVFEEKFAEMPDVHDEDSDDLSDEMEDVPAPLPAPKKSHSHKHDKHDKHDKHHDKHHHRHDKSVGGSGSGGGSGGGGDDGKDKIHELQSELDNLKRMIENMKKGSGSTSSSKPFDKSSSPSSSTKEKQRTSSTGLQSGSKSSSGAPKKAKKKHKEGKEKEKEKEKDKHKSSSSKPRKPSASTSASKPEPEERKMTLEEMKHLSERINDLPPEKLGKVVEIIQRRHKDLQNTAGELEIDIDSLDARTLRELELYVSESLKKSAPEKSEKPKRPPKPAVSSSSSDSSDSDDDSGSSSSSDSESEQIRKKKVYSVDKPKKSTSKIASPVTASSPLPANVSMAKRPAPAVTEQPTSAVDFSLKATDEDFKPLLHRPSAGVSSASTTSLAAVVSPTSAENTDLKLLNEGSWASLLTKDESNANTESPGTGGTGDGRWSQVVSSAKQQLERDRERKEFEARRQRELEEQEYRRKQELERKLQEERRLEEERRLHEQQELLEAREAARRAREQEVIADDDADAFL